MARDVDAPANPDALVLLDRIEEAHERSETPGPTDETAMKADRHHLRRVRAFGMKDIETVAEICKELIARIEALRCGKTHVVGVERVGDNEMIASLDLQPIGQVVGVAVHIVVIRRLRRSSVASSIMSDNSVAVLSEEEH